MHKSMNCLINNFLQAKTPRRNRQSGRTAILAFQNGLQASWREAPRTYLNQGSGNIAHHLVKKSIRRYGNKDLVCVANNIQPADSAHRIPLAGWIGIGKTAEIFCSKQKRRFRLHQADIQPAGKIIHGAPVQSRWIRTIQNSVLVRFGLGRQLGMKTQGNFFDFVNGDIWRKIEIKRPANLVRGHVCFGQKMRHLTASVYPSISSPGTNQHNPGLFENTGENFLHLALDSTRSIGLRLPAVEIGAVILNGKLEITHAPAVTVTGFSGETPEKS